MEVLYILIALSIAFCLIMGAIYLKESNVFTTEDLDFIIKAFDLSMNIVDELNLKKEPQIKQISKIVLDAFNSISKTMSTEDKEEIKKITKDYTLNMCKEIGIQMNENRLTIIDTLIEFGFNAKYAKK